MTKHKQFFRKSVSLHRPHVQCFFKIILSKNPIEALIFTHSAIQQSGLRILFSLTSFQSTSINRN